MNLNEYIFPFLPDPPYNYDKLVLPEGPEDAKVVILGEAPGEDEIYWKPKPRNFVGGAGQIMDSMLKEAGINRYECLVFNTCWERPTDNKFKPFFYQLETKPRKRWVPTERLKKWWRVANKVVEYVKPNIVIAFGNEPLLALTGLSGITKRRGSIYLTKSGVKVIPVLHPAAVMRMWKTRSVAIHDLLRAKEQSQFPERIEPSLLMHIDPEFRLVMDFLDEILRDKHTVTIDLETRGLHIACLGIGYQNEALVIPFMRTIGHYWRLDKEARIVAKLIKILRDPEIGLVGQNFLSFDSYIFWKEWGVLPRGVVMDTMHAQHTLYPERFGINMGLGLEFLCSLYTDPVINYYKDEGKTWERKIGENQFWTYCGKDVCATHQSAIKITQELAQRPLERHALYEKSTESTKRSCQSGPKSGLRNSLVIPQDSSSKSTYLKKNKSTMLEFYTDHVLPLSKVLQDLQVQGIRVDQEKQSSLVSQNRTKIDWMQKVIDEILTQATMGDISSLNVRSNPQMKNLLYAYLNLPRQYKRDGGKRKVTADENAIVQLKKLYPEATKFFDFLLHQKLLLKEQDFLKTPVAADGRMRTVLNPSGTETGRLNSRKPPCGEGTNLQNVKNKLRCIFIPDEGKEMWEADLSQAEARVVALLAEQWDLVDLFQKGEQDVHWWNAQRIFGHQEVYNHADPRHSRERYLAKRIIHASNYGMSWYKFRQLLLTDAGLDYGKKEVETMLEAYHKIYPNIRGVFHAGARSKLRSTRELVNPFGRRRIFYDRWPTQSEGELFRKAYAFLPQSTVVDQVNRALIDFHRWTKQDPLRRVQVLHQNHDSIVYQTCPAYARAAAGNMKELMERPIEINGYSLTIPCDFQRGMNWGKATKDNPDGLKEVTI